VTRHMFYQSMTSVCIGMYHPPDDCVLLPGINLFLAEFFVANHLCFIFYPLQLLLLHIFLLQMGSTTFQL
jgi:hypothetical protein